MPPLVPQSPQRRGKSVHAALELGEEECPPLAFKLVSIWLLGSLTGGLDYARLPFEEPSLLLGKRGHGVYLI